MGLIKASETLSLHTLTVVSFIFPAGITISDSFDESALTFSAVKLLVPWGGMESLSGVSSTAEERTIEPGDWTEAEALVIVGGDE